MHDDVNGIRLAAPAAVTQWSAEQQFNQALYSQDALTVEGYFTAAPTVTHHAVAYLQVYYTTVPGIAANLRHWAEVQPNVVNYLCVPVTAASSGTAGQWGAGVAINHTVDVFKANTLYALIGYLTPITFGAFTIQGVDVGNLQIGAVASTDAVQTRSYFARLSTLTGKATIPVINSQNKGATNLFVSHYVTSTTYETSLIFAQLSA